MSAPVVVIGAGISGVACARELVEAGVPTRLLDRGYRIGGRLAAKRVDDRSVDLGASYFTVSEPAFDDVVQRWAQRGLAREWTDHFTVLSAAPDAPDDAARLSTGPVRWSAPGTLRGLVEDLAIGLPLERATVAEVTRHDHGLAVDGEPAAAVVLAMPDGQARTLLVGPGHDAVHDRLTRTWEPVLALVARWPSVLWGDLGLGLPFEGAFVNDDDVLSFVADDGRRRGDAAPVLVAHSTPEFAAQHLVDPDAACPPMVAALRARLDLPEPESAFTKRWSMARPTGHRHDPFLLTDATHGAPLAVCGDGWGDPPRVQTAWLSGHLLGRALVERLG